jgi:hypothetical protein
LIIFNAREPIRGYDSGEIFFIPGRETGVFKQTLLQETVPVYQLEIERAECRFDSLDQIAAHLKALIEANGTARFIAIFDHYAHTRSLPQGQVAKNIRGALNVIFCFGLTLPEPVQLANRPRSIGVCEIDDRFIISFMEAPMPVANAVIEDWAMSLYVAPNELETQANIA